MSALKIATKYLLFVLVPVVISVVFLSIGLYRRSSHALMEEVDRRLSYTARHIKNMVDGNIEKVKSDLLTLLANKSLEEYFMYLNIGEMDYVEDARATLEENFLKIAEAKPHYPTLRIFRKDARGIVNITDNRATHKYPDPTETNWFKSAFNVSDGETYVSNIYLCPEHQLPSLFISQPYYYLGRAQAVGVVHLHIQDFFGLILRDVEIGKTGYAYLVNRQGIIIAHKSPSLAGTDVSDLFSTRAVISGKEGTQVERDPETDILLKKSYLPLKIKGSGIVVAQPLKEAMAVSNSVRWYVIGISSVVAIFLLMLLFFVSRKLVINPVRELSEATKRLLLGDLTARVTSNRTPECWNLRKCKITECPAYGDEHRSCWHITGTKCPTCAKGDYASKIDQCKECDIYQAAPGDEIQELTENFNLMALSLNENIAGLKDTENRLRQQGQLLQTILDTTPDFVSLQDRHSAYQSVNKSFCSLVGKSEEEIIGRTDTDIFQPRLAEIFHQEDQKIIESGTPLIKETEIAGIDGKRWLHIFKIPVYDAGGKMTGLLCSGRDITELKRIQNQLTRAQKMESVGQLTAGIAHEINTPLGIILGYAQLLIEDFESESSASKDLIIIEKQTKICRKIVSDLLEFSRDAKSTVAPLDLNQSIKEVITVVEHIYRLDRITIEQEHDSLLPLYSGDKEKLKQVFINLLNNARNAIGTDGTIHITTRFDKLNRKIRVYVADTGCGIAADKIDRIFDPFFTTKSVAEGTGLGLSVSFGIIREHGGKIEAESPPSPSIQAEIGVPERGTVFIISLPAESSAASENQGTVR
jgi:PAS domain S-box-containing protein